MNTFTQQEHVSAEQLLNFATTHARHYAGQQDHQAAIVALLIEALILAGGQALLKAEPGCLDRVLGMGKAPELVTTTDKT